MDIKKVISAIVLCLLSGVSVEAFAIEYHVAKHGSDSNQGSLKNPFLIIQKAADVAQPGDTVTIHEGIYRERINPPRGGTSDAKRITYQAASGEKVIIKGSEVVKGWKKLKNDTGRRQVLHGIRRNWKEVYFLDVQLHICRNAARKLRNHVG